MASIFKGIRYTQDFEISKAVKAWMIAGLIMVFMQVVIGGITRLTGSGLSITKWEIVTGTIPPLSTAAWEAAFELYKQTPQYQRINAGMQLSEFKFIFFWEYFHRLWARLMFFVFIIPFGWFLYKGMFSRRLLPRMVVVVLLAGLEGFFGWIMVASGLTKRPWVNAYNLTLHLTMALIIFSYLLWTTFIAYQPKPETYLNKRYRQFGTGLLLLTFVQLALGAMMSGTKAGLFFPTWPDIGGAFIPEVLMDGANWQATRFIEYDTHSFMPALLHFLHRNTAYLLSVLVLFFVYQVQRQAISPLFRRANWIMVGVLITQVTLGIVTLINCKAKIPVDLGVAHQAVAVLLLGMVLFVNYQMSNKSYETTT